MSTIVGVSLKTYFGHEQARAWFSEAAFRIGTHPAVASGAIRVFVIPTYLQIPAAIRAFAGTAIQVGAQDVSAYEPGPYTGEVTAAELAEVGVALAEIGHAERRRLFGETDTVVAAKTAAALRRGIAPVLCVGETERMWPEDAEEHAIAQVEAALLDAPPGPVVVAYEPVWAIGAPEPASAAHIAFVTRAVRDFLAELPERDGSAVIYGGSAGPGLLTRLGGDVDGLFLGRFAHDVDAFAVVVEEAARHAGAGAEPVLSERHRDDA
jgi:triosephosphate isomerase (TIM)